jgi:hypothetical protein
MLGEGAVTINEASSQPDGQIARTAPLEGDQKQGRRVLVEERWGPNTYLPHQLPENVA